MTSADQDIDELQASLLRSLASVHRLRILHLLGARPYEVNLLARELGMSQTSASQHLGALRAAGIVVAVRDGRSVSYQLADPQVLAACQLMRAVLVRRLSRLGDLAAAANQTFHSGQPASEELQP